MVIAAKQENLGVITWAAANPFGEQTSYMMVYPRLGVSSTVVRELRNVCEEIAMATTALPSEIPVLDANKAAFSLHGNQAKLWLGDLAWISVPTTDMWTGNAIGRRYVVLVIGAVPGPLEMRSEEISDYLRHKSNHVGLVRLRLRATEN